MFFPWLLLVVSPVFSSPAVDDSRAIGDFQTDLTKTGEIHSDARLAAPKPSLPDDLCKGKPIKRVEGRRRLSNLTAHRNETADDEKLAADSANEEVERFLAKKFPWRLPGKYHTGHQLKIPHKELVHAVLDYDEKLNEDHMEVHE